MRKVLQIFSKRTRVLLLCVTTFLVTTQKVAAAIITTADTGSWTKTATWRGGKIPTSNDTVHVNKNVTLYTNTTAVCAAVFIGDSNTCALKFLASSQLTVSGRVTMGSLTDTGNLTMTLGGFLICTDFIRNAGTFTRGIGTVKMTATNTLPNTATLATFNNLIIASGTTTLARSTTINGTLTILSGATLDVGVGNKSLNIKKIFSNSGTFVQRSGNVTFNGTTGIGTMSGSVTTTFYILTVNNSAGATVNAPIIVNKTLAFSSGKLFLDTSNITVLPAGSITGITSSSYIVTLDQVPNAGMLIMTGTLLLFPIGISTSFTPITIANSSAITRSARVCSGVYVKGDSATSGLHKNYLHAVNREWFVTSSSTGVSASVTVQWNVGDENTNFYRGNSYVSRYDSGKWNNGNSSPATGLGPWMQTLTGVKNLSIFAVGDTVSALPVTLTFFEAKIISENVVELNWSTASEYNNQGFEIERSENGTDWVDVKFVEGHDNSTTIRNYSAADSSAFFILGPIYYRLKQIDFNGAFEYSAIRVVTFEEIREVRIFPNPTTDLVSFVINPDVKEIRLKDILGKSWPVDIHTRKMSLRDLKPGIVFFEFIFKNKIETIKIVKQ